MTLRSFVFLVLGVLLATSCSSQTPKERSTSNREVRILSLSPHATEIVFALGNGEDLVGVTDFCILPPGAESIPRLGGLMNPNVEQMMSVRPTVGFFAPTARGVQERLSAAGTRMVPLPNETLEEILSSIRTAGQELDRREAANALVTEIRDSLEALAEGLHGRPKPLILFVVGHAPGALRDIHAVGTGTFLDELITLAGGENLLADSSLKYPQVSREALIQRPPQVVLMARPVGGWTEGEKQFLTESWRGLVGSSAGELRVVFLEDPRLTIPGPGVHLAARQIADVLHPENAVP